MSYVVTRLAGGLGNQMFEYAAGRCAADSLGVPLYLDTSLLEYRAPGMAHTARDFALDAFQIRAQPVPPLLLAALQSREHSIAFRLLKKIWPAVCPVRFLEDNHWMPGRPWPASGRPLYMRGYWQDEKYFQAIRSQLCHADFTPAQAVPPAVAALRDAIKKQPCISVHVRRGDYVTNPRAAAFHGTCGPEYYARAASILSQRTGVAHFFLFSDDMEWAAKHLELPGPTTCVQPGEKTEAHWELWLMQQCDHHIIANSSFSWWGAWLNDAPGREVVAPLHWFANQRSHIAPAKWIRC